MSSHGSQIDCDLAGFRRVIAKIDRHALEANRTASPAARLSSLNEATYAVTSLMGMVDLLQIELRRLRAEAEHGLKARAAPLAQGDAGGGSS